MKTKLFALITTILALLIAAVPVLAATTYVWVEPTLYGDATVNEDGTLTLYAENGGSAGAYWSPGMTFGDLISMTNLWNPVWIEVQSNSYGTVVPWEQNGLTLDNWLGLWYGPEAVSPLNDPAPFWLNNDLTGAWLIDPANTPTTPEELLNMPVSFYMHIETGPGGKLLTHVLEYCVGGPPQGDGPPTHRGDEICFRFRLPEGGDARITFQDVMVAYYPQDFTYVRAWQGSPATGPRGEKLWELNESKEAWSYAPWNVGRDRMEDGSLMRWVKGSFSVGDVAQPIGIEFHDVTSGIKGSCLTLVYPKVPSAINYEAKCYQGKSLEQLVVSGIFQGTYAQSEMLGLNMPVGRVTSYNAETGEKIVTWYAGQ